MSNVKTWQERVLRNKNALPKREMQAEIDELRAKLAALEAQPHSATLHDDGYWTWNGSPPYESQYAGWRLKVYLAAGAAPVPRMTGAALASQEPVAEVLLVDGEKVIDASMAFFDSVELGTKLYLAAGAAPKEQL